jgi:DNA repair protein RadC
MKSLSINQWSEQDRPREKLEQQGPQALSDAELLAILIGSGSAGQSAVDLMKDILNDCHNNLNTLGKLSIADLTRYKGMGPAKAVTILAACELGKRRAAAQVEPRQRMDSAQAIYENMLPHMQDLGVEEFWALYLNQNYKLIKKACISRGGISETAVDIRLIMKEALLCNATVVALAHNHPSGNTQPSRQDDALTRRIKQACDTMRIYLLDHIVVTDGNYFSYREHDRI